jgi:hypothetical protein
VEPRTVKFVPKSNGRSTVQSGRRRAALGGRSALQAREVHRQAAAQSEGESQVRQLFSADIELIGVAPAGGVAIGRTEQQPELNGGGQRG